MKKERRSMNTIICEQVKIKRRLAELTDTIQGYTWALDDLNKEMEELEKAAEAGEQVCIIG